MRYENNAGENDLRINNNAGGEYLQLYRLYHPHACFPRFNIFDRRPQVYLHDILLPGRVCNPEDTGSAKPVGRLGENQPLLPSFVNMIGLEDTIDNGCRPACESLPLGRCL